MKAPADHPYYILPAMERLKHSYADLGADEALALKRQVALNAADADAVAAYVDLGGDDWAHMYPPKAAREGISTVDAIDTFLNVYGHQSEQETALLERLIFHPTADYATVLEQQEKEAPTAPAGPKSEQDALLDAFLSQAPAAEMPEPQAPARPTATAPAVPETTCPDVPGMPPGPVTPPQIPCVHVPGQPAQHIQPAPRPPKAPAEPKPEPKPAPAAQRPAAGTRSSSLSESLAKVYIKQHRYERAYEIISELNLNNPEKSVYFADQLRFLKKLIAIEKARKARQHGATDA